MWGPRGCPEDPSQRQEDTQGTHQQSQLSALFWRFQVKTLIS